MLKARLLSRLLGAPVQGWRWPLVWAAAAAILVGYGFTALPQAFEWAELAIGVPLILLAFGWVVWMRGFTRRGPRALFRAAQGRGAAASASGSDGNRRTASRP